jgi:hypothetical protein
MVFQYTCAAPGCGEQRVWLADRRAMPVNAAQTDVTLGAYVYVEIGNTLNSSAFEMALIDM